MVLVIIHGLLAPLPLYMHPGARDVHTLPGEEPFLPFPHCVTSNREIALFTAAMASLLFHSSLRRLRLTSPTVSGGVMAYSQVVTSEGVRRTSSGVGAKARSTADEFDRLHAEKMAKSTKERVKVEIRQHAMEAAGKNPQISKEKVINDIEV